jgi:hypothetical protein
MLLKLRNNDYLYIQQCDDSTRYHLFRVTGDPTDATTYVKVPITSITAGSNLQDTECCGFVFTTTGDPATHASTHANGGADEINVGGLSGTLADAQTPSSHASTHQNGGSDEVATATPGANAIPKAGAGSTLAAGWLPAATETTQGAAEIATQAETNAGADDTRIVTPNKLANTSLTFTPSTHANTHENGGADEIDVGGLSGTLADPQTPSTHASTHQDGGSDEVATATPGANDIPKAGGTGTLAAGWLPQATESAIGASEIATQGETDTGTDDTRIVTPLKLATTSLAFTPVSHASTHQNGGSDEVATSTPATNSIPKTAGASTLAAGWIPQATESAVGGAEIATTAEATAGTDDTRIMTAAKVEDVFEARRTYVFYADQLQVPNNSDWTVNAAAGSAADSNNAGIPVRRFDDTTPEGVGFTVDIPSGATFMELIPFSRAETAPPAARTVGLRFYERGFPGSVDSWSSAATMTDIDIPATENWVRDTESTSLGGWGLTAGQTHQIEIVRDDPTGGTELSGDWTLGMLIVDFT